MILPYLLVISAYLIGSVPFGFLAGRLKGVDLRATGSGNIGATNAGRVLGKWWGYGVFALDFLKGATGVALGRLAEVETWPEGLAPVACGSAAFLGHIFPIYLAFKGGKGVATGAGIMACLVPGPFLCSLLAWVLTVLATRMISAGSVVAAEVLICWASWVFKTSGFGLVPGAVWLAGFLVIAKHAGNIFRILKGTENRLPDGFLFRVVPGRVALATGSAWLGMGLFFSFVTGLGTFAAFERLSLEEPRPYWIPLPEAMTRDASPALPLPHPLRKEQGSLLAGISVSAQFPWYFQIQAVMGAVLLGTVAGQGRRRFGMAALAMLLAISGWTLERRVEALRLDRNEATSRFVNATEAERASMEREMIAARVPFREAHGASVILNLATLACVGILTIQGLFRQEK
ncbi:MAG: glycerol-3-phosphate 1-O-acyltransferase PlsY [Planctomycetes bacterium]|nr:glycerol-3-phosphate 1-O-acyltransferase PlsY [Planctomycetota bacterium]